MLHTDTYQGTTTNLTPQDANTTWHNAFTEAFDIYANVIKILKQFCNKLNVILVPGNHDRTKSFYLAYGLEKYFETDSSILFDTNPTPRKIYTYGSTFIGLHHGDCKITDLPLIFAKEFSKEWGQCTYHQILTGDKHHVFEKEIQGVRVRQLPSLSKEDNWHNQSNYINAVKAAMAIIYDKEHGCCMTIEERL
jgi:UDP-2,3-diacylglucosamine pyrophosphatase LpxH